MFSVVLLIYFQIFPVFGFQICNSIWRTTFVNLTVLLPESGHRIEEHVAESLMRCNLIANDNQWAKLMCYEDGQCKISNMAVSPSILPEGLVNPVKCLTTANEGRRPRLIVGNFEFIQNSEYEAVKEECEAKDAEPFVPKTQAEFDFLKNTKDVVVNRNIWYPMVYDSVLDKEIYDDGTLREENPFQIPPGEWTNNEIEKSSLHSCSGFMNTQGMIWVACLVPETPTLICWKRGYY